MDEIELNKCLRAYDPSLQLGNKIGDGGTAMVYELQGTVPAQVLKVMHTNCYSNIEDKKKMRNYFQNEIKTMEELRGHKYIMPVIDSYEYVSDYHAYESVFLVRMKKMLPLTDYYRLYGLTEQLLIQLAIDISKALQICEEKHILHRDVKPGNIFISSESNKMNFVLGDFGFCRRLDAMNGRAVTQCGTTDFMAPEIFARQPLQGIFNADIYSLGISLYYIASNGYFPSNYNGEGSETWEKFHGLSDGFVRIIRKASQADPKDRYQHASDMLYDLNNLRSDASKNQILNNKPYFFSAKQAMLKGRFDEALSYAEQGVERQEDGCSRLYAYCLYRNHDSESSWDQEKSEASIKILDHLAEEGDAVARCIRATIYSQKDEWDKFYINMKKSAEDGCVIAQYYYGRALYEGWAGRQRETAAGQYYIQNAAKENYLPALRILKRIMENNPGMVINPQLIELMENYSFDEERLRSDIVRFL